ncbi:hypothetical protein [Pseudomonas sp.]|uniref:hypothetical protein n=1 Tax=Pseudomonas sp. TaxID=306 RepID=UPI002586B0EE|nr:hypothetical protein [Pseudomonas sp.]
MSQEKGHGQTPFKKADRKKACLKADVVGASLLAMVVNDNARLLIKRGVLKSIVGTPPGAGSLLQHWFEGRLFTGLSSSVS